MMTRPSWAPAAVVSAAIGFFVVENRAVHLPTDDAYIFYRYAQHLAHGDGLVYNIGERVEGFTSLLWTLLVAAGIRCGGDAVAVGHWLGVGSGALLLWLTYAYAAFGLVGRERVVAALSAWLFCLSTPFAVWSTSGLETPLFAAAAVAALIAEGRGRPVLALGAAIAAVVLRPDGILLGAVVFVFLFVRGKSSRKTTLALLAAYFAVLALLTGFRLAYFGAALPNTFYAKVGAGGAMGWWGFYVYSFVVRTLAPMVWPSLYAWRDAYLRPGLYWCACVLFFVVAVGGDAFPHSRFFVAAMPVLCALVLRGAIRAQRESGLAARFAMLSVAVCAVWFTLGALAGVAAMLTAALLSSAWGGGSARRAVLAGAALLLGVGVVVLQRRYEPQRLTDHTGMTFVMLMRRTAVATRWFELEEARDGWGFLSWLGQTTAQKIDARPPPDKVVAALGIGSFGFHTRARVLDIVGLVDPTIARSEARSQSRADGAFPGHQRANTRYVLSRNPDYILIPRPEPGVFRLPAIVELWNDPEFLRRYKWDRRIAGYRRRR